MKSSILLNIYQVFIIYSNDDDFFFLRKQMLVVSLNIHNST